MFLNEKVSDNNFEPNFIPIFALCFFTACHMRQLYGTPLV